MKSPSFLATNVQDKLREELDDLIHLQRPQLLETINELGRSGLDSSDATFRETRKSLQRIEKRVAFLSGRLEITEIIDPLEQNSDHIRFGATVTVQPLSGPESVYRIVGIDEADIAAGNIYDDREDSFSLSNAMAKTEKQLILKALAHTEGKKGEAAELLGISRKNLWEKIKLYQIT